MLNDMAENNFTSSVRNTTPQLHESHPCSGHVYRNRGNMALLDMLDLQCGTALDVGCGAGDNARILDKRGWSVSGITLSQEEQTSAAPTCSKVWVHDLDTGLPADVSGPYDLILLSHVLEHLRTPETLLCQFHRFLRRGGQIAVALPNILNWHQRLLFVLGSFEYREEGIMDMTHLRFYTFSSAKRMLEACGFTVVRAKASGSILPWGPLRRLLPSLTSTTDRFFCWISPGLFGRQILYLAKTK
jgi:2-polyprenyl-3-methyl-5-hydroxy-6-metoxy-1,4-benzoquinol methylase